MDEKTYVVITGACGGLGQSFVKECLKEGKNLILTGTSEEKLKGLLSKIDAGNCDIKTFVMDLGKAQDREKFLEFLSENELSVCRLINNAGVIIEGDLERFEDSEIAKAIEVNCVGTLDLTKKLLRVRNKERLFEVLTVSSVASSYPIPHMAVYAATKAFLTSMMTSLAVEFAKQNVVVTTVCPGGMATTQAMKDSIKSMGLGGKLSCVDTDKVAKLALKALRRKKRMVIPGNFNRFLVLISKPFSKSFMANRTGKIWEKSQKKRNF